MLNLAHLSPDIESALFSLSEFSFTAHFLIAVSLNIQNRNFLLKTSATLFSESK